jgi:chemotaxis receptor (MCP) glutamine deamidase CheD
LTPWAETLPEPDVEVLRVSLMQGDVHYGEDPTILLTVLGSCVAVCLWDRALAIGGMNHFVLPAGLGDQKNTRYGIAAIDELVAGLRLLGSQTRDLQAKVFGGAAVLRFGGHESVGTSNVRLAIGRLRYHHIPITVQRTGGTLGQQIRFHTGTGEVMFRHLAVAAHRDMEIEGS